MENLVVYSTELPAGSNKPIKFRTELNVEIDNSANPGHAGILDIQFPHPTNPQDFHIGYTGCYESHTITIEFTLDAINNSLNPIAIGIY
ncbi:MAG: hypothetical protein HW421_1823 [Ignavibacteria bacterium]|nr:hypothetical protein [Ignavibacteria bacterium]